MSILAFCLLDHVCPFSSDLIYKMFLPSVLCKPPCLVPTTILWSKSLHHVSMLYILYCSHVTPLWRLLQAICMNKQVDQIKYPQSLWFLRLRSETCSLQVAKKLIAGFLEDTEFLQLLGTPPEISSSVYSPSM